MNQPLLAIDIGNTKTAFAFVRDGKILERVDVATNGGMLDVPIDIDGIAYARIASVVPSATERVVSLLEDRYPSLAVSIVRSENIKVRSRVASIDRLGVDRLLVAIAGYQESPQASETGCIVINAGTATTIECISSDAVYLGGTIALGLGSTLEALHERTALLPAVPLSMPTQVVGTDTVSAIQSGVVLGGLYAIQGLVERMRREAFGGAATPLIASGGSGKLVADFLECRYDPDLVLKGLAAVELHD